MKKLFVLLPTIGLLFLVSTSNASAGCNDYDGDSRGCNNACSPPKADGTSYACKYLSTTQHCVESTSTCGGGSGGTAPDTRSCSGCTAGGLPGQYSCSGSGYSDVNYAFCGGCVNSCVRGALLPTGCRGYINTQCGTGGTGYCSAVTSPYETYYCQGNPPPNTSLGCQSKDPLPGGVRFDDASNNIIGSFCGTVQIDDSFGNFCSRTDTSGCSTNPPPTVPPATPPPSTPTPPPATPTYAGQCQDIKLYAPDWSPMTLAAFSKLTPGAVVYMCVKGTTLGLSAQILGSLINATYVGQSNPGDWLGVFKPNAEDTVPVLWKWLNNTNSATPPSSVPSEILVQFGSVPAGSWEVRYIKAGSATAGSKTPGISLTAPSYDYGPYDMARFTINGVLRPQVQTKREFNNLLTVNDYCDLYKIPTGMYKFAVQGEIHHAISGWK